MVASVVFNPFCPESAKQRLQSHPNARDQKASSCNFEVTVKTCAAVLANKNPRSHQQKREAPFGTVPSSSCFLYECAVYTSPSGWRAGNRSRLPKHSKVYLSHSFKVATGKLDGYPLSKTCDIAYHLPRVRIPGGLKATLRQACSYSRCRSGLVAPIT